MNSSERRARARKIAISLLESPDSPVNVAQTIDVNRIVTDPSEDAGTPRDKVELKMFFNDMLKRLTDDCVSSIYTSLTSTIDKLRDDSKGEDTMKRIDNKDINRGMLETLIRRHVRAILQEAGVGKRDEDEEFPDYYSDEDRIDDLDPNYVPPPEKSARTGRNKAFKATALGRQMDGKDFRAIADELGMSVSGAKQAVDKALRKARWVGEQMNDPDLEEDLEGLVLQALTDYPAYLQKSGELSAEEVKLLRDNPEIVRELDGFREFLSDYISAARGPGASNKEEKLSDPLMGESRKKVSRKK